MPPLGSKQSERLTNLLEQVHNDSLLDLSFDANFVRNAEGRITYWNQGAVETYGYSVEEALGQSPHDLLRTEFPVPLERIRESLDRDGRWSGELTHTRKDGTKVTVSSRWSLKLNAQGATAAILESNRDITEYKNALNALRETEQRLRFHLENTPLAVIEWGADFRLIRWSGEAERIFGWRAEEVLGKQIEDLRWVYEEDLGQVASVATGLLDGSSPRSISRNRNYRKDGSLIHCEWYNSSNVDDRGNLISIFSLVLEVTERKSAEERLRASEERFRKIYENAPTGIAIVDFDGKFVQCNRAFEAIVGYSEAELRDLKFPELIHPEDREDNLALNRSLLSAKTPFFEVENRYCNKNGEPVWVQKHVSLLPDSSGKPALVVALVTDITQRKKAQAELSESEAKFRTLANSIPQLCWMANPDGGIFWYNDRWYEYTGTTPAEMEGWGWQSVHDPEILPAVMQRWNEGIAAGEPLEMVFPLRGRDGVFRPFLTCITPMKDANGNVVRWFGTNTNITEQRAAEQALIRSEKLASAGRLAATVAHEINNPLEAIMNLLYLARSDKTCPPAIREFLVSSDAELKRVSHITRQVLGFYRDSGAAKEISITAVMEEAIDLFAKKIATKQIKLEKEFGEDLRTFAVSGELRQVFSNLIANSLDAVAEGGTIKLRISKCLSDGHPGVRATIADNGGGISNTVLPNIFEPFFTTKGNIGTGLGLWVTKQLVEKQGGSIRVRSSTKPERRGTTFSIVFPALESEPNGVEPVSKVQPCL